MNKGPNNYLTIQIEQLEKAEQKLPTVDSRALMRTFSKGQLLNTSELPGTMVDGKSHSFLQAMYYCYSDHRPFVLTPESIWLLVLQAFSVHMNSEAGAFTKQYPDFKAKRKISVRRDRIKWGDDEDCRGVIDEFCDKVDQEIDDNFVATLSRQFSKTSIDEHIAFKISALNTVKSYFEFVVVSFICGIPSVQITGTKEDWLDIVGRLAYLRKFEFGWFVDRIVAHVQNIAAAYDEARNDDFWINMFKLHTVEEYGNPKMVDGWITDFFPYKKNGERVGEDYFKTTEFRRVVKEINPQIVGVDFKHEYRDEVGNIIGEVPMYMMAGFIGIEQDDDTLALTPKLGWAISKHTENVGELAKAHKNNTLVYRKLESFPDELLEIEEIYELRLNFIGKVVVPVAIKEIKLSLLRINGRISRKEKHKIREIFKNNNTLVFVNGEDVNTTLLDRVKRIAMRISPFHDEFVHY